MYKLLEVVRKFEGHDLISVSVGTSSPFAVKYKVGIPTYPRLKNSRLFVFNNIKNVVHFWQKCFSPGCCVLFHCDVENIYDCAFIVSPSMVRDYWDGGVFDMSSTGVWKAPPGTYTTESVILTEPVSPRLIGLHSAICAIDQDGYINHDWRGLCI